MSSELEMISMPFLCPIMDCKDHIAMVAQNFRTFFYGDLRHRTSLGPVSLRLFFFSFFSFLFGQGMSNLLVTEWDRESNKCDTEALGSIY